jgi:hypothetical protein
MVIQPHGRTGQYNPHVHCLATRGGWDQQAKPGVHLEDGPSPRLGKKWQWHLLTMLRQTVQTRASQRLVAACYTRYREGFVTNVPKGDGPSRYQSLAMDRAPYGVSPPISLRRLDRYDGHHVTYHYRSQKPERVERETVEIYPCLGRMVQQAFPKGFQRIRSYGVQATKTFATRRGLIPEALATVKGIVKGAIKMIAPMTYRQRDQRSTGRDPWRCPYGGIHDACTASARGK